MEKKLSGSSRRGTLTSVKAEDIFNKPLTKRERETVRRTAERQGTGDDSHIDYSDIPPLTDEQLAAMTRFRDVRDRLEMKSSLVDALPDTEVQVAISFLAELGEQEIIDAETVAKLDLARAEPGDDIPLEEVRRRLGR
jgi:hypothetical protein